jgi:4-amino-4-deoxy-L-arabinose transferase-like glycosyltransferase
VTRFDRVGFAAIIAIAAALRLVGLDSRHGFDADQGHDMLTLLAFTRDGVIPLLGPRTSVGEFHHGAFYYFLLAPAAAVSGSDPVVVTAFIALLGIGAVGLTWWLARSIGGSLAGVLAGLLLAVSPAGIEESTFIWNPNPIGFFAVLALGAAWKGRATRHARWWALALGSAGVVVQLHVLGIVFFVAILAIALLELRRDRSVAQGIIGGLAITALLFVPLLAHELQTGFLETQRLLDYLRGGDESQLGGPVTALAFTLLRVVGWPIVGLVTDVPMAAAIVLAVTIGLTVVGLRIARGDAATAFRWFIGTLAWSVVTLAFAAPSLQRVVPGLPNDHYHASLDPIVAMLIAIPAAWLFERARTAWGQARTPAAGFATVAIAAGIAALVFTAVIRQPAWFDPNGWRAMQTAGVRIVSAAGERPINVVGLPDFKLPDAISFPIAFSGGHLVPSAEVAAEGLYVIACDRLFERAIGAPCGGPAEDAEAARLHGIEPTFELTLRDRFDASPRTSISIYAATPTASTP